MIIEYIRYRLPSERCIEFERAYGLAGEPLLSSPHCLAYELTRCTEDPTCYVLRIEWDSAEGHRQGFRGSAEFRAFFRHIQPFVSNIEEMRHYESVGVQHRK
jgi:hemoglobin